MERGWDRETPHPFVPRAKGSKLACKECGAPAEDPIHRVRRGQVIVEMALILPIFLVLILGFFWVGEVERRRLELTHAAQQGAIAGAGNPGDSCGVGQVAAATVYGHSLDVVCDAQGGYLTLTVSDTLRLPTLWGSEWRLSATQRAVLP